MVRQIPRFIVFRTRISPMSGTLVCEFTIVDEKYKAVCLYRFGFFHLQLKGTYNCLTFWRLEALPI